MDAGTVLELSLKRLDGLFLHRHSVLYRVLQRRFLGCGRRGRRGGLNRPDEDLHPLDQEVGPDRFFEIPRRLVGLQQKLGIEVFSKDRRGSFLEEGNPRDLFHDDRIRNDESQFFSFVDP